MVPAERKLHSNGLIKIAIWAKQALGPLKDSMIDDNIMHSDHLPGVTTILTTDESRKSLEMAVNAWKSRSQLAPKIGKGKYVLAEYEKIKGILMRLGGGTFVYSTTELQANHLNIISGITSLASSFDSAL